MGCTDSCEGSLIPKHSESDASAGTDSSACTAIEPSRLDDRSFVFTLPFSTVSESEEEELFSPFSSTGAKSANAPGSNSHAASLEQKQ